jgi:antitoxin HigA-1
MSSSARNSKRSSFAPTLGVSRQTLYDILDEKQPVTVNMALRLGKLCGDGPRIWLAMQQAYDMQIAEREMAAEIEKIPTLRAA